MAAPALRGQTAPVAGGSTTSPASTQVGDLVVVYTFERLAGAAGTTLSVNAGAGFSQIRNHFHDDSSTDGALAVAYKVAAQGGAQSYQGFTSSTGTPVWWTGCTVLQANTYDASAIVSAGVSQTNNATPNPPNVAGLTSTRDYLVLAIAGWHLGSALANTATAPANYGDLVHLAGSATGDLACASRAVSGVTSEDPAAFGDNQAPNGTCAITMAVPNKAAPSQGTGTSALTLGSSGVGRTVRSGFAAAALVVLSAGVGHAPATAAAEGSGTGALSLATAGAGTSARRGDGALVLALNAVSVGQAPIVIVAPSSGTGIAGLQVSAGGTGQRRCNGYGSAALALSGGALPAVVAPPPSPAPACPTANKLDGVIGGPSIGRRRK
jgi:hypothetical protein